ncbi:hypothetical protein MTO96_007341 [Rhipicephalus appendiculatus]
MAQGVLGSLGSVPVFLIWKVNRASRLSNRKLISLTTKPRGLGTTNHALNENEVLLVSGSSSECGHFASARPRTAAAAGRLSDSTALIPPVPNGAAPNSA